MKRLALVLCAALALGGAPAAETPDARPIIAVVDFRSSGIARAEVDVFVDLISSYIVATKRFTVIDRGRRDDLLREIEFSRSDCSEESCGMEIGRLLSASLVVVGSLGKVGDWFILNMKLVEVQTGAAVSTASERYRSMNAMVEGSEQAISVLVGGERPAAQAAAPEAGPPTIVVSGTPTARIYSWSSVEYRRHPVNGYLPLTDALSRVPGLSLEVQLELGTYRRKAGVGRVLVYVGGLYSVAGVVGLVSVASSVPADDPDKQTLILALSGGTLAGVLVSLWGSAIVGKPPTALVDLYNGAVR